MASTYGDMTALIGETVVSFGETMNLDKLIFRTESADFIFRYQEDCCSETFLNHVNRCDELLGHKILSIDSVESESDQSVRQEYDEIHLWRLTTSGGTCELEVRNSSNGYYGGNVEYIGMVPAGEAEQFIPITADK